MPEATSTDLAEREGRDLQPVNVATMDDGEINRLYRVSRALAASGMFKDATSADQAFAKILLGRDLGLSPTQALTGIHIVEGKPEIAAVTLAGFVQQHEDYDYEVIEHDADHCKIRFSRRNREGDWGVAGVSEFTMDDARKAQLVKEHAKAPWNAHPRNMLFARAMSNGVKWFCAEVTRGVPVYHEGELERVPNLAEGEGDGPIGLELPEAVEGVIERAAKLGHRGLADRGAAEMACGGQSDAAVRDWVERAGQELDVISDRRRAEAEATAEGEAEPQDAEVVDGQPVAEGDDPVAALNDKALEALNRADALENAGDLPGAEAARAEAEAIRSEAMAMIDPDQHELGEEG